MSHSKKEPNDSITKLNSQFGRPDCSVVDTFCLLGYSDSCKFDLKRAGGIVGMIGGGEGIFNSTITGPGLVIMQSMNRQLLLDSLAADKIYRR